MKKIYVLFAAVVMSATVMAQEVKPDPFATGLGGVATVVGETRTSADSVSAEAPTKEEPVWKQKLYYGYNFDIYWHHDSKDNRKENGWSFRLEPEIGWKLKERFHLGMRFGGSYQNELVSYSQYDEVAQKTYTEDIRVIYGSWEVTPYVRYRLKTMFNDKLGIWLEAHLYTGMSYPRVVDGTVKGTDYEGLRSTLTYGVQVSPVITYQFNRKSTFQIFFSIMSLGYSGTTRFYVDQVTGARHQEFSNDVILFSGKLKNLLANQFTPGLYGLKFGVQKKF
jgi:hypothetical protein